MITNFLKNTIYIQIRQNQFRVRHIEGKQERNFQASLPFTTRRLLVGHFNNAATLLKKAINEIGNTGFFKPSPAIVMHPMEMTEEGMSQVEERVYRELAMSAGARKVVVYAGSPLSDAEVATMVLTKNPL